MLNMTSNSITFVALYTVLVAMGLSLYGKTVIVSFTSLRGDYIAPCFSSSDSSTMKLVIFGGAIILYANLLLVCAVFFGEVAVRKWTHAVCHAYNQHSSRSILKMLTLPFVSG
jgi:hypothetical protein